MTILADSLKLVFNNENSLLTPWQIFVTLKNSLLTFKICFWYLKTPCWHIETCFKTCWLHLKPPCCLQLKFLFYIWKCLADSLEAFFNTSRVCTCPLNHLANTLKPVFGFPCWPLCDTFHMFSTPEISLLSPWCCFLTSENLMVRKSCTITRYTLTFLDPWSSTCTMNVTKT